MSMTMLNKNSTKNRAVELCEVKEVSVKEICELFSISKPTLYSYVREAGA